MNKTLHIMLLFLLPLIGACQVSGNLTLNKNHQLIPCKLDDAEYCVDLSMTFHGKEKAKIWKLFYKALPLDKEGNGSFHALTQLDNAEGNGFHMTTSLTVSILPSQEREGLKLYCNWSSAVSKGTFDGSIDIQPFLNLDGWCPIGYYTIKWVPVPCSRPN